ncbi:ABC transporter substrate-binding protein [Amycolatopsis sp. GM8]|uniref:ABC transporter substrate-binding protein n=1 Tax=Amycolatopsis sp. GM8 TaxID=2896530 RepID=UPI001F203FF8|nr:ABC transporter substrate-binding protein [Amycolatopsis sp. GM8]
MFTKRRTGRLTTAAAIAAGIATIASFLAGCTTHATETTNSVGTDFIQGKYDSNIAQLVPPDIAGKKQIDVASGPGYPPFLLLAGDGKTLAGAEPELLRAITDVLGLKPNFVDVKFDAMIPGLQTKRYDVVAAALSITPARMKQVDFVSEYSGGTSLIVSSGNPLGLSLDSMCGHKIAVMKGSIYAENYLPVFDQNCQKAGKPAIDISVFPAQADATLAVSSGRADASMSDYGPLSYIADQSGGRLEVLNANYQPTTWGYALPQGSALAPAIAGAMNKLISDGTYGKILAKWKVSQGAIAKSEVYTDDKH